MNLTNSSGAAMSAGSRSDLDYFPPPEAVGGWRYLSESEIGPVAGFDAEGLAAVEKEYAPLLEEYSTSIVVIRHGWLVKEFHSFNVPHTATFDLWSGTKSFTATAWAMALEAGSARDAEGEPVSLDTPAYDLLPAGKPLSDPRKAEITLRHLLSMSSGIAGETTGICGMPTATDAGIYEYALGLVPNRYGQTVGELAADPGTVWDYSDPAYSHLAMCFKAATGVELAEFMEANVFAKLGITAGWDQQGGAGWIGPHTNPHTGLGMSARDYVRFGYMVLRGGRWGEEEIISTAALKELTTPSQPHNRAYGLGWWTNAEGRYAPDFPNLPRDLVACSGFHFNRCYVIPSLDLVVARVGTGPAVSQDHSLVSSVVAAIVDAPPTEPQTQDAPVQQPTKE
ncbi:MAG: serine hydrolase [Actinobacteria bacterium]|nr:serine hydrolase [Actinomycetota bacterium]